MELNDRPRIWPEEEFLSNCRDSLHDFDHVKEFCKWLFSLVDRENIINMMEFLRYTRRYFIRVKGEQNAQSDR